MKILRGILFCSVFTIIGLIFSSEVDAAYGSWKTVKPGCEVRVWTDAYHYTATATSIDWFAQQRGTCGTLYYRTNVESPAIGGYMYNSSQTGYFNSQTPTKRFIINDTNKTWIPSSSYNIRINLYSSSSMDSPFNYVRGHSFTVSR